MRRPDGRTNYTFARPCCFQQVNRTCFYPAYQKSERIEVETDCPPSTQDGFHNRGPAPHHWVHGRFASLGESLDKNPRQLRRELRGKGVQGVAGVITRVPMKVKVRGEKFCE